MCIFHFTFTKVIRYVSSVIRSAFRLSRRLDLCNAARTKSLDRRHVRELSAIGEGAESRSKFRFSYEMPFCSFSLFLFFIVLSMTLHAGRIIEGYPLPRTLRFR